jgi:hypothetical protein
MLAAEGKGLYGQRMVSEAGLVEARLGETAAVLLAAAEEACAGDRSKFSAYAWAVDAAGWDARRIAAYCGHGSVMERTDCVLRQ